MIYAHVPRLYSSRIPAEEQDVHCHLTKTNRQERARRTLIIYPFIPYLFLYHTPHFFAPANQNCIFLIIVIEFPFSLID